MKQTFDRLDVLILSALNAEPRLPVSEIGDMVHLSRTAVSRRISAMKDRGAFKEQPEIISYSSVGFAVHAFVEVFPNNIPVENVVEPLLNRSEVIRVSVVAGSSLLLAEVIAPDVGSLGEFIEWAQRFGNTDTKIVFSETRSTLPLRKRLGLNRPGYAGGSIM